MTSRAIRTANGLPVRRTPPPPETFDELTDGPPPPEPRGRPRSTRGEWKPLGEVLSNARPTDEQREVRDHVLDLARALRAGEIDRASVRRQSTGYERFTASRFTAVGTDDRAALDAMTEDLSRHEAEAGGVGAVVTRFGIFSRDEIGDAGARIRGDRIDFAIRSTGDRFTYAEGETPEARQKVRWAIANAKDSAGTTRGVTDAW